MRLLHAITGLAFIGLAVACSDVAGPAPVTTDNPLLSLVGGTGQASSYVTLNGSNLCMDVKGSSTTPGTPILTWGCSTGKSNQTFTWASDGSIHAFGNSSLCLDDQGGAGSVGDQIIIYGCNGATNQKWTATSSGGIKGINGLCMAPTGTAAGSSVKLATCTGSASQGWSSSASGGSTTPTNPTPSTGAVDFRTIAQGIRPRGYGQGTYTLKTPATGAHAYYVSTSGNDANSGSSSAPFRTIAKAAQVAHAGDVVTIQNGTYTGNVVVMNSGTSSAPIVFQAANRGGVILTGGAYNFRPYSWSGGAQETGQLYVTVRGLIFRGYASNATGSTGPSFPAALKASRGWRIEDCLFDNAGNTAIQIEGSYVTVIKSTLQYTYFEALSAWAHSSATSVTSTAYTPLDGIQIIDVVLHDNYTKNVAPSSAGVADYSSKFMTTRGTVIDNMESYSNNGPGFWFDTQNSNFTVKNSYFHNNKNISGTASTGRGLNFEANWAPGLVQNNVFANNASMGLEVTATQGVTIRNNLFISNPRCMELTNDPNRVQYFPLKNIGIYNNQCGLWSNFAGIMTIGGSSMFTTPSQMGIKADSNVYQNGTGTLGWWENKTIGAANSISDFQTKWGWEQHGRMGTISWP